MFSDRVRDDTQYSLFPTPMAFRSRAGYTRAGVGLQSGTRSRTWIHLRSRTTLVATSRVTLTIGEARDEEMGLDVFYDGHDEGREVQIENMLITINRTRS